MNSAREVFGSQFDQINQYVDILISRGIVRGLLGPREAPRVWERHILNSVAIADLLPVGARVADVGSGAGLPGIPLAILRPDLTVWCIEPLLRRFTFLAEAVSELGLGDRVRAVRCRAEEYSTTYAERFDVVTSRALAPLSRLAGWCVPLLARDGRIIAIKGRSAQDEVERDQDDVRALGMVAEVQECRIRPGDEVTYAVTLRRA